MTISLSDSNEREPRHSSTPIINMKVRKAQPFPTPLAVATELPGHGGGRIEAAAPTPPGRSTFSNDIQRPALDQGEVLITRGITFRNSTFGGLKAFQREYQGCTGVILTNAAAVDLLLRELLPRRISMQAAQEMSRLSVHKGMLRLQDVHEKGEA